MTLGGSHSAQSTHHHHHHHHHRRHVVRFVVIGIVIALLVALGGYAVLLLNSLQTVKSEAQGLEPVAQRIVRAVEDGDTSSLQTDVQELQAGLDAVKEEVDGALWTVATFVPVYGQDVTNARKLLSIGSNVVADVLVPATDALASVSSGALFTEGGVNGDALKAVCDALADASPALTSVISEFEEVGSFHIASLNDAVDQLRDPLATIGELLEGNGDVIRMLPDILGCNGARTYLVVAQNNSELRSTGGLPGAIIPVTVDNGQLTINDVLSVWVLLSEDGDMAPITDEEIALWGTTLGITPTNFNDTLDFSRAAQIVTYEWERTFGTQLDGVLSVDVIVFARLLGLTGQEITLSNGSVLNGDTAVSVLLHDIYWEFGTGDYTSEEQSSGPDALFAEAARAGVDAIMSSLSTIELSSVLDVFQTAVDEGRILGWMSNEAEEGLMERLGCSGELFLDPTEPVSGIYLIDNTWSKISWWIGLDVSVGAPVENEDGSVTYHLTATLTNTMTEEEAATIPRLISGTNLEDKRDVSDALTIVYLTAPAGGSITNAQVSGSGLLDLSEASYQGISMLYGTSSLMAGESLTISYDVTTSAQAESALTVHATPLAQEALYSISYAE